MCENPQPYVRVEDISVKDSVTERGYLGNVHYLQRLEQKNLRQNMSTCTGNAAENKIKMCRMIDSSREKRKREG